MAWHHTRAKCEASLTSSIERPAWASRKAAWFKVVSGGNTIGFQLEKLVITILCSARREAYSPGNAISIMSI